MAKIKIMIENRNEKIKEFADASEMSKVSTWRFCQYIILHF